MNTTEKGDAFEADIVNYLKSFIANGGFFINTNTYKIFSKKGYYSKDRNTKIVFDISIECYMPGHSTYSLLILIECKSYSQPVPVSEVEEFGAKIQQIPGVKGIVFSTNSFQKGAVNYAKSKGIGLVRYFKQSECKWILTRSPSLLSVDEYRGNDWIAVLRGMINESHRSAFFDCYCFCYDYYTNSLGKLFIKLFSDLVGRDSYPLCTSYKGQRDLSVEYFDKSYLEDLATNSLGTINYSTGAVPLDKLCEWQSAESGLRVSYKPNGSSNDLLGKISFEPPEITIFIDVNNTKERERFTLAHELSHLILKHDKYMLGEYCQESDIMLEGQIDLGYQDIMRMEWQANYIASCLLLPPKQVVSDFLSIAESAA